MFYLGNFLIFFAFNLLAAPLDEVARHGMQPSLLLSLFWATVILGLGLSLAYHGSAEKHPKHSSYKNLGVFMMIVALLGIANVDTYLFPSDLAILAAYLIPGMMLYSYNKEETRPKRRELPRKEEVKAIPVRPISLFDQVIIKFKESEFTNYARRNPAFMERLCTCEAYLKELSRNEYTIDPQILKQINEILDIYLELQGQIVQTPKIQDLLETVVGSFDMITKSLESMYDKNFEMKALGIESNIKSLEMKLQSEGLLGSDFDLSK